MLWWLSHGEGRDDAVGINCAVGIHDEVGINCKKSATTENQGSGVKYMG